VKTCTYDTKLYFSGIGQIVFQQQPLNSGIHEISPTHPDGSNFWYESIVHNGQSPFIPNGANWKVFRNVVTDYGADNTGGSDASNAIIKAITGLSLTVRSEALTHKSVLDGSPSGSDRTSNKLGTTGQPAVVYLPAGTYTINSPLQLYVGTVLMGNPLSPAIIKASSDFQGSTLIFGKDPNRKYPCSF
jgi:glucan 1,3-beta-glucosidase